jgi:glycerophosphoryl diester phosphodiesterase
MIDNERLVKENSAGVRNRVDQWRRIAQLRRLERRLNAKAGWRYSDGMLPRFDLQGHRGARGLRPENTLPSIEAALDAGVTSIETDLHLTRDGTVVLYHDPFLNPWIFHTMPSGAPPAVRSLSLAELRRHTADGNPDPTRFLTQAAHVGPVAAHFTQSPYAVPTLGDFVDFVACYAGPVGASLGKSEPQRDNAARLRFDLELKRQPFHPEYVGDDFDGTGPAELERTVIEEVRRRGIVARTSVRSFDHRCLKAMLELEPGLTGCLLIDGTAPLDPAALTRSVGASIYCPGYRFVDADLVRRAHAGGVCVVPWTANDETVWKRLLAMGVDGITTDYPDRLASYLAAQGMGGQRGEP